MKKVFYTIVLALISFYFVTAQNSSADSQVQNKSSEVTRSKDAPKLVNQNANAPVLSFDKTVHDYGQIEQHGDGKCEFKFTNTGKEPLILSNVRSSCGCTVPQWPRQPILPGDTETIYVKYDTKRVGIINKSIQVYSNASDSPLTLKIKGKVLAQGKSSLPEKKSDDSGSPINK